jgi:hypothetical protein
MKKIKTTKHVRNLYAKHLNMLLNYSEGLVGYHKVICHMCVAADELLLNYEETPSLSSMAKCSYCPLSEENGGPNFCAERDAQDHGLGRLKNKYGKYVNSYLYATKESIRKRVKWIQGRIHKTSDCRIYDV